MNDEPRGDFAGLDPNRDILDQLSGQNIRTTLMQVTKGVKFEVVVNAVSSTLASMCALMPDPQGARVEIERTLRAHVDAQARRYADFREAKYGRKKGWFGR